MDKSVYKHERAHLSKEEKAQAVLRLLQGENVGRLGEELGVSVRRLERWEATFVGAGTEALTHKSHRRTVSTRMRELSKPVMQWILLLVTLVAVILLLLRFFDREPIA